MFTSKIENVLSIDWLTLQFR